MKAYWIDITRLKTEFIISIISWSDNNNKDVRIYLKYVYFVSYSQHIFQQNQMMNSVFGIAFMLYYLKLSAGNAGLLN